MRALVCVFVYRLVGERSMQHYYSSSVAVWATCDLRDAVKRCAAHTWSRISLDVTGVCRLLWRLKLLRLWALSVSSRDLGKEGGGMEREDDATSGGVYQIDTGTGLVPHCQAVAATATGEGVKGFLHMRVRVPLFLTCLDQTASLVLVSPVLDCVRTFAWGDRLGALAVVNISRYPLPLSASWEFLHCSILMINRNRGRLDLCNAGVNIVGTAED
ncbi:hypothetical protein RRG08_045346 [Elysia crispata]|uniref:Uncharacterized protein n=1 Tax=Elysia crispata TaxID=231223 RepID=A0AAE1A2T7_9GAST|nr:hypothetical protein RRG08_045346 [Elysia crispata]